jgi:hypothetical protein
MTVRARVVPSAAGARESMLLRLCGTDRVGPADVARGWRPSRAGGRVLATGVVRSSPG